MLRAVNMPALFITHDQEEALELADRVVVMNTGRIEQIGTPDDVYHRPATPFVSEFLGEVNVFRGRLEGDRVRFGSIELPVPEAGVVGGSVSGEAHVFVRPHDVTIDTRPGGPSSIEVTVARIHAAGSSVRLELRTARGQSLAAEISQERFDGMHLRVGGPAWVRPRHIRVFAAEPGASAPDAGAGPKDDYAI